MSPFPTGTEIGGDIPYDGQFFDKGGAVYNIMHPGFGAKGDGTTDDTAAIQAAIDGLKHTKATAGEQGVQGVGGVLYFPTGIYIITAPLVVDSQASTPFLNNVSFIGEGPNASIIKNTATAGEAAIQLIGNSGNALQSTLFRDIGLEGNASSGHGIDGGTRVSSQFTFDRFQSFGHGGDGVNLDTTNNNIVCLNSRFRENTGNGFTATLNSEQVWFYGCSFRDNDIGLAISSNANICNIYGGDIHGNRVGLSISGGDGNPVTSIEARGIYFEVNERDVIISNIGSTNFSQNITIAANSFSQTTPTDSGRRCIEIGRAQYAYIYHNEFRNITNSNVDACIRVGATAEDVYIGPNWFPSSTTRPFLSIDASATRTWGHTNLDTNVREFHPWGVVADVVTTLDSTATPSVSAGNSFKTVAAGANITDFDDGVVGQTIYIEAADSIDIAHGASTIRLVGAATYSMTVTDTLVLHMFTDGIWTEVSRSVI